MTKYGSWDWYWVVPGIAPSRPTPVLPTPGTPLPTVTAVRGPGTATRGLNEVVGLKSVAQLTLDGHFSGFQGITEGYNLTIAGNPNNHKSIPGND